MGNLADQLLKAGMVTQEAHRESERKKRDREEAQVAQHNSQLSSKHNRPINTDRIQACETIVEFKAAAKDLLLEHPELIGDVVREAHRFKNQQGGNRLVWLIYSVRDGLKTTAPEDREQFLRRAFRRHGLTLEKPQES